MGEPSFRIIASTRKPGVCRSCAAAITWAQTFPKKKAMPLHGDPAPVRTETDLVEGEIQFIASKDSHFAQCKDAKKWSRR